MLGLVSVAVAVVHVEVVDTGGRVSAVVHAEVVDTGGLAVSVGYEDEDEGSIGCSEGMYGFKVDGVGVGVGVCAVNVGYTGRDEDDVKWGSIVRVVS
jgi:hypothetical protein